MKISELAKQGVTRVTLVDRQSIPVWNKYSFADLDVFSNGCTGPWVTIYDPCGNRALGNQEWVGRQVLVSLLRYTEFQPFTPPDDMHRFPGYPPIPAVRVV